MRFLLLGSMACSLALVAGAAAAQTAPVDPLYDELMRKSGLWRQVAEFGPLMHAGLDDALAKSGRTGDPEVEPLKSAITLAYAADRLRAAVRAQLATLVQPPDVRSVLAWLDSDLGRRVTVLEETSSEPAAVMTRREQAATVLQSVSQARTERLRRFVRAVHLGEASASIAINSTIGIARGMAPSMPGFDVEALRERLEGQRSQLAAVMEEHGLAEVAMIYGPLSDAELDEYLAFAESPVGRRYHAASVAALDRALADAAVELGKSLGSARSAARPVDALPVSTTFESDCRCAA